MNTSGYVIEVLTVCVPFVFVGIQLRRKGKTRSDDLDTKDTPFYWGFSVIHRRSSV